MFRSLGLVIVLDEFWPRPRLARSIVYLARECLHKASLALSEGGVDRAIRGSLGRSHYTLRSRVIS